MPECLFCRSNNLSSVFDLGFAPYSNSYIAQSERLKMEPFFPLKLWQCRDCGLVQLEKYAKPEDIFLDYDYFSSYSKLWLAHAYKYTKHMIDDYGITPKSKVVELASNDGYLLQYFLVNNVDILGVEPAANVAKVAIKKGIPTEIAFFGEETANKLVREGHQADLILGNNVIAHVPDINDFVEGMRILLKSEGFITLEFPHLLNMINFSQFDTIYHEHFFYHSLTTLIKIFKAHMLRIFNVEELSTHGGSLRIYACHEDAHWIENISVNKILGKEKEERILEDTFFSNFRIQAEKIKLDLLQFMIDAKRSNKKVCAYGAAAKGNTLLNYCGIKNDLITAVADKSPAKQGKYLPGSHIPIISPDEMRSLKPEYVLILPWNLKDEIMEQEKEEWAAIDATRRPSFVTAIPKLEIYE